MHVSEAGGNFQIFLFFLQSRSIIILCALGPHFPLQRGIEKKKKEKNSHVISAQTPDLSV